MTIKLAQQDCFDSLYACHAADISACHFLKPLIIYCHMKLVWSQTINECYHLHPHISSVYVDIFSLSSRSLFIKCTLNFKPSSENLSRKVLTPLFLPLEL